MFLFPVACLAVLWAAYFLAAAVYNLYFHPLSKLPGPRSWIILPLLRQIAGVRGILDLQMKEFHDKYGDVVRSNPNEVSFITSEAWKDIYGHPRQPLPKYLAEEYGRAASILTAGDLDHARLRKSLLVAFSDKALRSQEGLVKQYVDMLVRQLKGIAAFGGKTDMFKWYNLTTFDVIGDLTFGESFKGVETYKTHGWIEMLFGAVKIAPFVRLVQKFPFARHLMPLLIPKSLTAQRIGHRLQTRAAVEKRMNNTEQFGRGDFMDAMLRTMGEGDEITFDELQTNAEVLVVAGSETMATLLSGVTYWLLKNPSKMEKITTEVRQAFESEEQLQFVDVVTQLPYMMACLNEAMRIYPPVPTGLRRITQAPYSQISGIILPPGCYVAVHQLSAYRSARHFHNPMSFVPERWLPEPPAEYVDDDKALFQPFSVGTRNCIGRNLAYNEVGLVLARVLWNFDLQLCDESQNWQDQKSFTLWDKSPLLCTVKPRA